MNWYVARESIEGMHCVFCAEFLLIEEVYRSLQSPVNGTSFLNFNSFNVGSSWLD